MSKVLRTRTAAKSAGSWGCNDGSTYTILRADVPGGLYPFKFGYTAAVWRLQTSNTQGQFLRLYDSGETNMMGMRGVWRSATQLDLSVQGTDGGTNRFGGRTVGTMVTNTWNLAFMRCTSGQLTYFAARQYPDHQPASTNGTYDAGEEIVTLELGHGSASTKFCHMAVWAVDFEGVGDWDLMYQLQMGRDPRTIYPDRLMCYYPLTEEYGFEDISGNLPDLKLHSGARKGYWDYRHPETGVQIERQRFISIPSAVVPPTETILDFERGIGRGVMRGVGIGVG